MSQSNAELPPIELNGVPITIESARIPNGTPTRGLTRRDVSGVFISDSLASDVSIESRGETLLQETEKSVNRLIQVANRQSKLYRGFSLFNIFTTVVSGTIVSVMNLNAANEQSRYASVVLGLGVAAIQALTSVFNVEKLSTVAKEILNRARAARRNLYLLKRSRHPDNAQLLALASEIDDLEFSLFAGGEKMKNSDVENPRI